MKVLSNKHLINLSICIPTYNFGAFIGETLESIAVQLCDGVEVVILDGGSTDNTPEVVYEFTKRYPSIKYYRFDEKGGIDRDIAKTVSLATGEYCWLFSSDDVMRLGAIKKLHAEIKSGDDVYLCKHSNCTKDMKVISDEHPVLNLKEGYTFNLTNRADRERYCSLALSSEAFFSFMSGFIIKRSKWESVPFNERFAGSCWAHAARIFELIPSGISVKYITEVYLDKRGDNDSFLEGGVVKRLSIAVDGYHGIADYYFGHDSVEAFHIRRVIRNEYAFKNFLFMKLCALENLDKENVRQLSALVKKINCDLSLKARLTYWVYSFSPLSLLKLSRQASRILRTLKNGG